MEFVQKGYSMQAKGPCFITIDPAVEEDFDEISDKLCRMIGCSDSKDAEGKGYCVAITGLIVLKTEGEDVLFDAEWMK